MVNDRIERDIMIEAPVERVWSLLTEAGHLGTWFGDAGATVDLRVGGPLTLTFEGYGTMRGVVEGVDQPTRFAFRWAHGAGVDPVPGKSTLVEFTLTPQGNATQVHLVETGFASLDGDDARRESAHEGNTAGWASELEELRQYAVQSANVVT